ncbi:MAG: carbohydrate-binding family 9-like protein, partial [Lentisphaeria bacterium]|nr:carbohydrate-binding family 9-like protein [Lentisphaeria bacterium]
ATGYGVTVNLGSGGSIVAARASMRDGALVLGGLRGEPTPAFGPASEVRVTLPEGDYPHVHFRLDLASFDAASWQERYGEAPFHFLTCSAPEAGIFHHRGWPIPTPVLDPYPLHGEATGYGIQIRSLWSRDWTYAPALGAHPIPVVGLWAPEARRYVAYDFHGARLTDWSERDIGTAYCWRCGEETRFITLVWPYACPYQKLTYPELPRDRTVSSWFRLVLSTELGSDDDPNELLFRTVLSRCGEALPRLGAVPDLSWLPPPLRPEHFSPPPVGRLHGSIGEDNDQWWKAGTETVEGMTWVGDPVTVLFESGDEAGVARLRADIGVMLERVERFEVAGEACAAWRQPFSGEAIDAFGPQGVATRHNIQTWMTALALLDASRNDPALADRCLPVVDGVLRWTRHILYTRNGYPDVPAAQFCWGAGPVVKFCLRYHTTFRDSPEREALAAVALKLSRTMLYRYLPMWMSDNNEADTLDSSFFMEPNSGISWLGAACANEVWIVGHALTHAYVATGDPWLGYCLRGMATRMPQLYRDEFAASIEDYGTNFTERLGLYPGSAQAPGTRATFGGLWGGFEQICWPVGGAALRVVCGDRAATAFGRGSAGIRLAEYRSAPGKGFAFRLAGEAPAAPGAESAVCVTYPLEDIRGWAVVRTRDGERRVLDEGGDLGRWPARSDSVLVRGLRSGDAVTVGQEPSGRAFLPLNDWVPAPAAAPVSGGWETVDVTPLCDVRLARDWSDTASHAGLETGRKWVLGVPFEVVDTDANGGRNAARDGAVALPDGCRRAYLLVTNVKEGATVAAATSRGRALPAASLAEAPVVWRGWPPCFGWRVSLAAVGDGAAPVRTLRVEGADLLAVTASGGAARGEAAVAERLDALRRAAEAEAKAVASVAALQPLFEKWSGRIALLPFPPRVNPYSSPLVRILARADLLRHVAMLTPDQLVDAGVFDASRFVLAVYGGGEVYWQTVSRAGDGDEALHRFLVRGGTLLVLPTGPFPFYYDQDEKPVVRASYFGLPMGGSGVRGAGDTLDVPGKTAIAGWEIPPEGADLTFRLHPGQKLLDGFPDALPFPDPETADPRWRPLNPYARGSRSYAGVLGLYDREGTHYGDAVAVVQPAGMAGRVVSVWSSLLEVPAVSAGLMGALLRFALGTAVEPPAAALCPYVAQPPRVDGALGPGEWDGAATLAGFTCFGPRQGAPSRPTTVRLCHDREALYAAFDCVDPDVWSTLTERDGPLWEGEVVELYVDPDGDGAHYREIEVNPLNAVVDLTIEDVGDRGPERLREYLRWDAGGMQHAVRVRGTTAAREDRDEGWQTEVAIPLAVLADAGTAPEMGETWRMQFYRIERPRDGEPEFSAWSATDTFHRPERFGFVTFCGPIEGPDGFDAYGDGQPPTAPWTVGSGEWVVRDGVLVGRDCTGSYTARGVSRLGAAWSDATVTLRFRVLSRGSDWRDGPWFGFRAGEEGMYSLDLTVRSAQLHKAWPGGSTGDADPLAEGPFALDTEWHELRVELAGNSITVSLDGQPPLLQVEDDNHAGRPPVRQGSLVLCARRWENATGHTEVAFDDVRVQPRRP